MRKLNFEFVISKYQVLYLTLFILDTCTLKSDCTSRRFPNSFFIKQTVETDSTLLFVVIVRTTTTTITRNRSSYYYYYVVRLVLLFVIVFQTICRYKRMNIFQYLLTKFSVELMSCQPESLSSQKHFSQHRLK